MINKLLKKHEHEANAKALLAFFIFFLAIGVLWLFKTYQESILATDSFSLFLLLTTIGFGLLLGLLYIVNNQKVVHKKASRSRRR